MRREAPHSSIQFFRFQWKATSGLGFAFWIRSNVVSYRWNRCGLPWIRLTDFPSVNSDRKECCQTRPGGTRCCCSCYHACSCCDSPSECSWHCCSKNHPGERTPYPIDILRNFGKKLGIDALISQHLEDLVTKLPGISMGQVGKPTG
ncbi:MAG: hypothetical protein RLZZ435_2512 [Cyanobacteriota bacterium]